VVAIEQRSDVGMFQGGENLALVTEAANDQGSVVSLANQFDRDFFVELIVGANAAIYFAHSAAAEFGNQFVLADSSA
jgi:hypothetical protein